MYGEYWDTVWDKSDMPEYRRYLEGYDRLQNEMARVFREHGVRTVCDAACGFGANSLTLFSNGFDVRGFDIAETSVEITAALLAEHGLTGERFKRADILDTGYSDGEFDAATARAVLDHLSAADARRAVSELKRITRRGGLLYASFDPLEDDDLTRPHDVTPDGGFIYADGMFFRHYADDEIKRMFAGDELLSFTEDKRGNRHIIIKTN